jgi:hypothetical protein
MDNNCNKLPSKEVFKGDWTYFNVEISAFFKIAFSDKYFQGNKVLIRHNTIYHILSENDAKTKERLPDMRRMERAKWIPHILFGNDCDECPNRIMWDKIDRSIPRLYIYCVEERYLIVLERHRNRPVLYLVTAYPVSKHNHKKYIMSYRDNKKAGTPKI